MTMKFYAYVPNLKLTPKDYDKGYGNEILLVGEPLGTTNRILFELKTKAGAKRRAIRLLGKRCRVFTYTSFYNTNTFHQIY